MRYEILLAPEAVEDLLWLSARDRAAVRDALEVHVRHGPKNVSRSRTKRLRGLRKPQYRLRVGEIRIFYDVTEDRVDVLAIIPKSAAAAWLEAEGASE